MSKFVIALIIFWTICAFETGRLVGRSNYRMQIRDMAKQIAVLEHQIKDLLRHLNDMT